jgi:hypothetical protein
MAFIAETLYPNYATSRFRRQSGRRWNELVDWVTSLPRTDPHVMAFTRTLRHINQEQSGHKPIGQGPICAVCAARLVDDFQGTEEQLLELYYSNLNDITTTIKTMNSKKRQLLLVEHAA